MGFLTERAELKSPHLGARRAVLDTLVRAWRLGELTVAPQADLVNLHCHTAFSYNGYGHMPSSLAWLAREQGWYALATVDFDVLDGVDECLWACDRVEVRAATGIETRVFLPEFAAREINSPGEPGVLYHAGIGFVSSSAPHPAAEVLARMRQGAAERNRDIVARINAYLVTVAVDYARDVLPLTPAGNATERHILMAYDVAARRVYPQRAALLTFWAAKLGLEAAKVDVALGPDPSPNELLRSKLMKRGGVGYVQPGPQTFPPVDQVIQATVACGAMPLFCWLDGSSEGEQHVEELLDLMLRKGVAAINIIPDRNWNYTDAQVRSAKVLELYKVVDLARSLDLPIIVGTEMNKPGQRLVDDLDAEPLRPLRQEFVRGADFCYGHTLLQRALGLGYQSAWSARHLPRRGERNAFYCAVGRAVAPGDEGLARVSALHADLGPDAILGRLGAG